MTTIGPISSDGLGLAVIGASLVFAAAMRVLGRERCTRSSFLTYLLEGVSLASSLVILVSLFSPRLFDLISDNKTFLMVVALMTLSYGLRDVFGRFDRPNTSDADLGPMGKREH